MKIIIETPRLIIREFARKDESHLVNLYEDEIVTRYVAKRTKEEIRRQFSEAIKSYGDNTGLGRWGVFNAADEDFAGVCILKAADSDPSRIELGYVLAAKYWGIGIATELAAALVNYGFEQKGFTEICACTHPENVASQNVLLKAGLKKDGTIFWHGADLTFFRITAR